MFQRKRCSPPNNFNKSHWSWNIEIPIHMIHYGQRRPLSKSYLPTSHCLLELLQILCPASLSVWPLASEGYLPGYGGETLKSEGGCFPGTCQVKMLPFNLKHFCCSSCLQGMYFKLLVLYCCCFLMVVIYLYRHWPVLSPIVSSDKCHIHF